MICPILFQPYSCTDVQKPEYSISINTDSPKPKRASSFKDGAQLRFLQITDVHFDPTYKPGSNAKCMEHLCCMSSSGRADNAADRAGYWTDYRDCDVPDYFIEDTFDHISKNEVAILTNHFFSIQFCCVFFFNRNLIISTLLVILSTTSCGPRQKQ